MKDLIVGRRVASMNASAMMNATYGQEGYAASGSLSLSCSLSLSQVYLQYCTLQCILYSIPRVRVCLAIRLAVLRGREILRGFMAVGIVKKKLRGSASTVGRAIGCLVW